MIETLMTPVMAYLIPLTRNFWTKWVSPLQSLGTLLVLLGLNLLMGAAMAAPPDSSVPSLLQRSPVEITVSLGTATNELKFVPDHLDLTTGQPYKLILQNPSQQKHYFTAKDFADIIWTQKVEAGNVEVKGAIHELELKPGATAIWMFIPIKAGNYSLRCPIPGHTEAGMTGTITVSMPDLKSPNLSK